MHRPRPGRVATLTAACAVAALVVAACAPTRAAPPPVPELVGAQAIASEDAGGAAAGDDGEPDAITGDGDRTIGDGTGVELGPLTGWAAFERSLERELIGGGSTAAAVAVAIDGEIVRTAAFGERIPGDPERPVGPDARFRIASISKVITAIVVLQLVEEGLIGLDEPVGGRLADHLGVTPADARMSAITVEHLLGHTSGFGAATPLFFGDRGLSCHQVGAEALTGRLLSAPGTGIRYSNTNSCLAGILIEAVTGEEYALEVYRRLLTPLGISGMRLAGTYDLGPDEVLHPSRPGRNYMEALGPAGGWIASAADVARIVDSINPATPGWSPLGDDLLERMRRPPFGPGTGGLGLGLLIYPDGTFGHTGTLENTHAMVLARPDGITWAVLVSGEHPRESARLRDHVDRALRTGFPDG